MVPCIYSSSEFNCSAIEGAIKEGMDELSSWPSGVSAMMSISSKALILSLMSLLNLKVGTKRSSMRTVSPVLGLRAGRALRGLQAKVPKPRISMVLPSTSFSLTKSRNCSMTVLMSPRTNPVDLAISCMRYCLVIFCTS